MWCSSSAEGAAGITGAENPNPFSRLVSSTKPFLLSSYSLSTLPRSLLSGSRWLQFLLPDVLVWAVLCSVD
ncbi:hypothetical protein P8452_45322 [Trifolium repens]|nr:hypothetical protein P8452_45322 [Trifolium repens]